MFTRSARLIKLATKRGIESNNNNSEMELNADENISTPAKPTMETGIYYSLLY